MTRLPYTLLDHKLDDDMLLEWYRKYSEEWKDTAWVRHNGGKDVNITELYAHELFINNHPEALEFKETIINPYVKDLLTKLNLGDVEHHMTFLITNVGELGWHFDDASSTRPGCSAAFMYSLNPGKRAATEWMYENTHYKLDGYKCSLINCSCLHRVDNRGHEKRITFRIAMYGKTFEEIQDRVLRSPYASNNIE